MTHFIEQYTGSGVIFFSLIPYKLKILPAALEGTEKIGCTTIAIFKIRYK